MGRIAINNSVSLDDYLIGRNPSVGHLETGRSRGYSVRLWTKLRGAGHSP
jgi:hypothetical protein